MMKKLKYIRMFIAIPLIGILVCACQKAPEPKQETKQEVQEIETDLAGKSYRSRNHRQQVRRAKPLRIQNISGAQRTVHLPEDAPNIVIFMTDDAGFSNPEDIWRTRSYANHGSFGQIGHQLQRVSHHRHVFSHEGRHC